MAEERQHQFNLRQRVSRLVDLARRKGLANSEVEHEMTATLSAIQQELGNPTEELDGSTNGEEDHAWRIKAQAMMGQAYRWGFKTPEGRKALAATATILAGTIMTARAIRKRRHTDE